MARDAAVSLEILDAAGQPVPHNSPATVQEGQTYTLRMTVTNTSKKSGVGVGVNLGIQPSVSIGGTAILATPSSWSGVAFAAGQSLVFQSTFTPPIGSAGKSGSVGAGVYDPGWNKIAEATEALTVQAAAIATLDIRAVPVLEGPYGGIITPKVYVDGAWVGSAPVLWKVNPGTYTISWEDKPGGDNPAPGVAYYRAPAAQTVTVVGGQTLTVTGTYTSVPAVISPPDVTLDAFNFGDVQPFLPSSTHIAYINITNPTDRTIRYYFDAYTFDPGEGEVAGRIGVGDLGPIPPGSWSITLGLTMPAAGGTYPIWLRFYENIAGYPLVYIKRVNTGKTATVQGPTGWPIETQLASIRPYLVLAGVTRYSLYWAWKPGEYMNLTELFVGETVEINVTQPCTLVYSGWTWNLAAGYNTITWGSPPPPPPPAWPIDTQLASIITPIPYLLKAWVFRSGTWYAYDPYNKPVSDLQEIYPGEEVQIQVLQACTLNYGGKTWNLTAGWNLITW